MCIQQYIQSKRTPVLTFAVISLGVHLSIAQTTFPVTENEERANEVRNAETISTQMSSQASQLFTFGTFGDLLVGRAVLPADSFAPGPTSGQYISGNETDTINGIPFPFINKQPIQGFSSVLNNLDGTYLALSDNGFGSIENSVDYNLRLYTIQPKFESFLRFTGKGNINVKNFIELKDPNRNIPFAIVNEFSDNRVLTGADFDIESVQRDAKGDLWIGDEFGPFILHFDAKGILLEAPIALPDFDEPGRDIRSPQSPYLEEAAALRIMNAMRQHALDNGSPAPVMSPWFVMMADNDPETQTGDRETPLEGLEKATSEVFDLTSLNRAQHDVVVYTVNDTLNMQKQIELGVQGIISDRPDLLYQVVSQFDADQDGQPDYLTNEGLINLDVFDAQGHRGARNLRPENTLPSMEAALDFLMPTLETDCGITKDGIAVLDHDPHIEASKTRKADGTPYEFEDEVLVKDFTLAEIQQTFIADKILPGRPAQTNELSLSPVAVTFAAENQLIDPYVMPSLQQLFDFVEMYVAYYKTGAGSTHPMAELRWKNAARVRYNIETKINPRTDTDDRGEVFAERTAGPEVFTQVIAETIQRNSLEKRADIQSFDFRTLLLSQKTYPAIRTVCLFGDFPKVGESGDGTNLQDQSGQNTPWLAGLFWPYRQTALTEPIKGTQSGGYEGMALTIDKKHLITMLEKTLIGDPEGELRMNEFDPATSQFTGKEYLYKREERGTAIGDYIMFSPTRGVVIERDGSQGDLDGFKQLFEIELGEEGKAVRKKSVLDMTDINDFARISLPAEEGDVGLGQKFAFPFVTIESVVVLNPFLIGILNDNNYPFSVGRHVGQQRPDDNEFILVWLDTPLGGPMEETETYKQALHSTFKAYPNTFTESVTLSGKVAAGSEQAKVTIYDLAGKVVATPAVVFDSPEHFTTLWNGSGLEGSPVAAGIYIAIAEVNGRFFKQKIVKE